MTADGEFLDGALEPSPWLDERAADTVEPEIRRLARGYQRRLALERDLQLASSNATAFETALRASLERLLEEDQMALRPAQKEMLVRVIVSDAVGYGPLDPLLHDPTISEIMVNAVDEIYVERGGQLLRSHARFEDTRQLLDVIRRMAASVARRVDETSPMVDARLPDGSRLNAVIPPAALRGPSLTIRKFGAFGMHLEDLVRGSTLSPAMAGFLQAAVRGRLSILISGGTGSGKTTTLNVLGTQIPPSERVVTIEDSAELQLGNAHVVGLEYRPPNVEGKGELTIRALVRNSLRMRPDRIIVGEVRDAAAIDMLQAMNTGHDGSMSTIHSNSARDAFSRLETMVLSGSVELPLPAVRAQIASAVNLVVHQARMPDGTRRIVQIAELRGYAGDTPVLEDIFLFRHDDNDEFVTTGHLPAGLTKMAFYGVTVPDGIFTPDRAPATRPQDLVAPAPGAVEVVPAVATEPSEPAAASPAPETATPAPKPQAGTPAPPSKPARPSDAGSQRAEPSAGPGSLFRRAQQRAGLKRPRER